MLERIVERTYDYDANGNALSSTDTKGQVTTIEYDELGRVV
jgi:YD repeat-containing protein